MTTAELTRTGFGVWHARFQRSAAGRCVRRSTRSSEGPTSSTRQPPTALLVSLVATARPNSVATAAPTPAREGDASTCIASSACDAAAAVSAATSLASSDLCTL